MNPQQLQAQGYVNPAQGYIAQPQQIIQQPVPTPPVFAPPPNIVPVYPEGQVPVAQQVYIPYKQIILCFEPC